MKEYTSQGFKFDFSPYDKRVDAKRGQIELSGSIGIPFEWGPDGDKSNYALLRSKIRAAAAMDIEDLEAMEESLDFQKVERATADALKLWAETVGKAALLRMARDVKYAARKPESTNNVWTEEKSEDTCCYLQRSISNNCFAATAAILGDKKYDVLTGNMEWSGRWRVCWKLTTHYPQPGLPDNIIQQENETFSDLDAAKAYIRDQMAHLTNKYFYSMDPVIPLEMRNYFLMHGVEIPGMNYAAN